MAVTVRRWRKPILWSLAAHLVGIALFWGFGDHLGHLPISAAPPLEDDVPAVAPDEWIMDVGLAVQPVIPTLEPRPAVLQPQPATGSVEPATAAPAAAIAPPAPVAVSGGGSASSAAGTGPADQARITTEFFQVATQAQSIVYVIDRSGSMGTASHWAQARRELLASLNRLPAAALFQVIAYNRTAEPLRIAGHSDLVLATAENKQEAALLLGELTPEGGTEHVAALTRALLLQPEAIYFLTDADDLYADQVRLLTHLNHGRAVIHTIALAAGAPGTTAALPMLARENRGKYQAVEAP